MTTGGFSGFVEAFAGSGSSVVDTPEFLVDVEISSGAVLLFLLIGGQGRGTIFPLSMVSLACCNSEELFCKLIKITIILRKIQTILQGD